MKAFLNDLVFVCLCESQIERHRVFRIPQLLPSLFSKEGNKSLDDLRKDENIVIVKPAKGNGVVIREINDFNTKMEDILKDTPKFERLNDDPIKLILKRENQLKRFLATLKKSNPSTKKPIINSTRLVRE